MSTVQPGPPRFISADLLHDIATVLADQGAQATLARLQRCSALAYDVVTPILYARLVVSASTCAGLLAGDAELWVEQATETSRGPNATCIDDGPAARSVRRRLDALRHVRHLVVRSLPADHVSHAFLSASTQLRERSRCLFPRLTSVSLLADALDTLRVWVPEEYTRPSLPSFLEAVARGARPAHLCVAYRLVPSSDWEAHRDLEARGMYRLSARVALLAAAWALDTFIAHDVVHQAPPALPCANTYAFSSHVIPHPFFAARFRFPTDESAIGIKGPEWTLRPWQLGSAIKSLFPSGADHAAVLSATSWKIANVQGHILTKEASDDDDGTGVGWRDVKRLVRESLEVGIRRDLPARDGFDEAMLDEVLAKITYLGADDGACPACGRTGQAEAIVSTLDDIM
ncbi:hypothetical protein Q5752_005861 [Cryptotrichosporon argae]